MQIIWNLFFLEFSLFVDSSFVAFSSSSLYTLLCCLIVSFLYILFSFVLLTFLFFPLPSLFFLFFPQFLFLVNFKFLHLFFFPYFVFLFIPLLCIFFPMGFFFFFFFYWPSLLSSFFCLICTLFCQMVFLGKFNVKRRSLLIFRSAHTSLRNTRGYNSAHNKTQTPKECSYRF